MSAYEVCRDFVRDLKHVRRPRHIVQLFRFIRKKNAVVQNHTRVIQEAPLTSPCLLSLGRDGKNLTRAFLSHYIDLGFKSFLFMDNGSTDGSVAHLIEEAKTLDCHVSIFECCLSYGDYKHSMKNFLIAQVPDESWAFCADDDEFLVLPDDIGDVNPLLGYLEEQGYDTVEFHLLDMFSDQPLHVLADETKWSSADLARSYPYFDLSVLDSIRDHDEAYPKHRGGVRLKHFGVSPSLTKATFFKKTGETNLRSSHSFLATLRSRPRRFADFTLFVKHYKFNARYAASLARAVRENSYYDNSRECRAILKKLDEDPSYSLCAPTTSFYENCEQLRAKDFITFSERFQKHLQRLRRDPTGT